MNLKDKVFIVTGSSMGIGKEVVLQLAEKGVKVVITSHKSVKEGKKVYEECLKSSKALFIQADMKKDEDVKNIVKETVKEFGKIDGLINNAGILYWKNFEKHTYEELKSLTETNLLGVMNLTLKTLPYLKKQKEAVIVNIASVAGKEPYGDLTPYCASKFGLRGFTQALAIELPENIKIYVVNPGMTKTRMTGFVGDSVKKVAEIIVNTASGKIKKKSGSDIDISEYI